MADHKHTHCDFCGKLLTQEDPGVEMHHEYRVPLPMDCVHCKVCTTKYYPGPWYVEIGNSSRHWYIRNAVTGNSKKIGKVQLKGVNYYERAREECGRRNLALNTKIIRNPSPEYFAAKRSK